jgi:ribose 5-phosphate isomerase B
MRVGIATDHGGFLVKEKLIAKLRAGGHDVTDYGAHTLNPRDNYPDFVKPLAQADFQRQIERGVAMCGSRALPFVPTRSRWFAPP